MQTTETVGILVRQKTSSTLNGEKLRDAQKEAYERQMLHEPGCTCCIILAKFNKTMLKYVLSNYGKQ